MTLRLDPPVRCGALTVAVLSEHSVSAHGAVGGVMGQARKTPAAILVREGETLTASDLRGRALDVACLETACPGLTAAMSEAAAD